MYKEKEEELIRIQWRAYLHVCMPTSLHVHKHACMHLCMQFYVCTYACINAHIKLPKRQFSSRDRSRVTTKNHALADLITSIDLFILRKTVFHNKFDKS